MNTTFSRAVVPCDFKQKYRKIKIRKMQLQASDTQPFKPTVFMDREVSTILTNTEAEESVLLSHFSSSCCFNNRCALTYEFQLAYQFNSAAALLTPTSSGMGEFCCLLALQTPLVLRKLNSSK